MCIPCTTNAGARLTLVNKTVHPPHKQGPLYVGWKSGWALKTEEARERQTKQLI